MIFVHLFAAMTIASSQNTPVPVDSKLPALPEGLQWELNPELSDEFDGSELDRTCWLDYHPYWKGREPSHFEPANITVQDGALRLRSTTQIRDLSEVANPETDVWVQSACVSSKIPCATYGYYEARMKASCLSMTSSFWLQGKCSEIDVVEQLGAPLKEPARDRLMLMNTHYYRDGWDKDIATPKVWEMPSGSADEYHTYGVWWRDKGTIWLYHDGERVAEIQTGGEFLEPMYLFFDTEVFIWEGLPTIESLTDPERNTMCVDWVRAWTLVDFVRDDE